MYSNAKWSQEEEDVEPSLPASEPTDKWISDVESELLRDSFKALMEHKSRHGLDIYLRLFQENPDMKKLFPRLRNIGDQYLGGSYQLREFVLTIMDTINYLLSVIEDAEKLQERVHAITTNHKAFSVRKNHIEAMKPMFILTVKSYGPISNETEDAWEKFFQLFSEPLA